LAVGAGEGCRHSETKSRGSLLRKVINQDNLESAPKLSHVNG